MRVAHITQSTIGGVFTYIKDVLEHHAGLYEATVICPRGGQLYDYCQENGVRVIELPMRRAIGPWDFPSLLNLYGVLRREKFDLVHLHSSKAGFLGRLALQLLPSPRRPRSVYCPHGWAFHQYMAEWKAHLFRALERIASPWADQTIAISEADAIQATTDARIRPEHIRVILNGINLNEWVRVEGSRLNFGIPDEALVYGIVGRLAEQKGIDLLLAAWPQVHAAIPHSVLVIVGDGPQRLMLERMVSDLGLESVRFVGWVSGDKAALVSCFDIGVVPSRWEGFGLVACEFMALGIPVVASRIGGLSEVVADGETGILVEPGSVTELANQLIRLGRSEQLRASMGLAGASRVRLRYDVRQTAGQLLEIYSGLMRY